MAGRDVTSAGRSERTPWRPMEAAGVRRRAPVAARAALPEVVPDAPDFEAQEAQRLAERLTRCRERPVFDDDQVDWDLATDVSGVGVAIAGSRMLCMLCRSSPCLVGCSWRELSHAQQAEYEWRLATRGGCVLHATWPQADAEPDARALPRPLAASRPLAEISADLARLRAAVSAAVEGIDVDTVFAEATLCAAADAGRAALSAAAAAASDEAIRRVLTRVCRLELTELLESDLGVWDLPAATPAALRAALVALRAALQAAPELSALTAPPPSPPPPRRRRLNGRSPSCAPRTGLHARCRARALCSSRSGRSCRPGPSAACWSAS